MRRTGAIHEPTMLHRSVVRQAVAQESCAPAWQPGYNPGERFGCHDHKVVVA
jgi:hypothetical protein